MKKISLLVIAVVAAFMATITPVTVAADDGTSGCNTSFLGLRTWYANLTNGSCEIKSPEEAFPGDHDNKATDVKKYVWTIAMNIVSMVLGIVGYLAIGLVMWGGIQYIIGQGDVEKSKKGKKTITNAVIGLVIVMSASIISGTVSDIVSGAAAKTSSKEFFLEIFNQVIVWTGVVAVIMVIWGGIQYITSTGNPAGISKAKNTIMYSMIGLLIVIFAATIVNTVVGAMG